MRVLLLSLFLGLNVWAQGSDVGNGGGIHYCAHRPTQELYDLYEGSMRYELTIVESPLPKEEIVNTALNKLATVNPSFALEVSAIASKLLGPGGLSMKEGIRLTPVPDANIVMVNEGCEYRQLANWDDVTNRVFVKAEFYRELNEFNRAAFLLHEAIYKAARVRRLLRNSDIVRRTVAELLSTSPVITNSFRNYEDFYYSSTPITGPRLEVKEDEHQFTIKLFLDSRPSVKKIPGSLIYYSFEHHEKVKEHLELVKQYERLKRLGLEEQIEEIAKKIAPVTNDLRTLRRSTLSLASECTKDEFLIYSCPIRGRLDFIHTNVHYRHGINIVIKANIQGRDPLIENFYIAPTSGHKKFKLMTYINRR